MCRDIGLRELSIPPGIVPAQPFTQEGSWVPSLSLGSHSSDKWDWIKLGSETQEDQSQRFPGIEVLCSEKEHLFLLGLQAESI